MELAQWHPVFPLARRRRQQILQAMAADFLSPVRYLKPAAPEKETRLGEAQELGDLQHEWLPGGFLV